MAQIGPGLGLPHPTAIVIGEGVRIGRNVTVYQNVTLGTRDAQSRLYPTVGDEVIIYPGSVVVGNAAIGQRARIGANSFVARDVPAATTVMGSPAVSAKTPSLKAGDIQ
ncbi:serine O-acetyltransferase [Sphingomonas sp.]|uniref:serine O-acetyltransferase n=1 Tax=Sphingomonas sp. TaxID=28214 RepID=UPI003563E172